MVWRFYKSSPSMKTEHFDAVIIGSGFGGSVMAFRLAEAGLSVCLLERGKPYPPNSFARSPYDLSKNFWDPSKGLYGMLDVWSFKGSGGLVSSGLGGGSLIYANILIRKDPKWFVKESHENGAYESWPVTYQDLETHYEHVEEMMNVQKYPLAHPPYRETAKTLAMIEADRQLSSTQGFDPAWTHQWVPLNLAVSFRIRPVRTPDDDDPANPPVVGAQIQETYPNYHSVTHGRDMPRSTCRLCGECDIGCNYGSKNTLDYTYITAAIHQKPYAATVKTLCEVKEFAPLDGKGYAVDYIEHDTSREGSSFNTKSLPRQRLTCSRLIISAGTFGSPFLLLKNRRERLPLLSSKLGARFSVNGDLLSFIVKSMETKNGQSVPRRLDPSYGPVITSAIRIGDTLDGNGNQGRGFYVEDGGNPYLLSWLSEVSGLPGFLVRSLKFLKMIVKYRWGLSNDADLSANVADLLGPANSAKSSFPILTMGRDLPNGNLYLKDGLLECDWNIKKSQDYYNRVIRVGQAIAKALKAEFLDNPAYRWNFHQVLTAHPLGGNPMGRDENEGVVDSHGEVFNYPGLYVADGSIMPGPVGPNPSLTIAALSDRIADHIIQQHKGATK
jgi:cholesterol oxidase